MSDIEKNEAFQKMRLRWGRVNKRHNAHKTHTLTRKKPRGKH